MIMLFKNFNRVRGFAVMIIVLSVMLISMWLSFEYSEFKSGGFYIDVHIAHNVKARHDVIIQGTPLSYGSTGEIWYKTRSFFDVVKFDDPDNNLINYLLVLIMGIALLVFSFNNSAVFFSVRTIYKFYALLGICVILIAGKMVLLYHFQNDFALSTHNLFRLKMISQSITNPYIIFLFIMPMVTMMMDAGIKLQNANNLIAKYDGKQA